MQRSIISLAACLVLAACGGGGGGGDSGESAQTSAPQPVYLAPQPVYSAPQPVYSAPRNDFCLSGTRGNIFSFTQSGGGGALVDQSNQVFGVVTTSYGPVLMTANIASFAVVGTPSSVCNYDVQLADTKVFYNNVPNYETINVSMTSQNVQEGAVSISVSGSSVSGTGSLVRSTGYALKDGFDIPDGKVFLEHTYGSKQLSGYQGGCQFTGSYVANDNSAADGGAYFKFNLHYADNSSCLRPNQDAEGVIIVYDNTGKAVVGVTDKNRTYGYAMNAQAF